MQIMLAMAGALALAAPPSAELLLKSGDKAPPFTLRDLERKPFVLGAHVGDKPEQPRQAVVIVFFATHCKPCIKEIPIMRRIWEAWQPKGVEVVYIGHGQKAEELAPFVQEHQLPWRVVPDSFGLVSRRYGASQLPHVLILDQKGLISFQLQGVDEQLEQLLGGTLTRLLGGQQAQAPAPTDLSAPRFKERFTLGRAPASDGAATRWEPLGLYVGELAQARIDVVCPQTYKAFAEDLKRGAYDLANAGPLMYHEVREVYEPVARLERQGTASYLGLLFSLRFGPIHSLADLRGKRLGLVAPDSSSGGIYQLIALRKAGLDPFRDLAITWLGSHEAVARAVVAGQVDAGGCFEDCRDAVWPSSAAKGAQSRLLTYTDEIPAELILVRRALPAPLRARLRAAILQLAQAPQVLTQISQNEPTITAVVPATAADYANLGAVLACANEGRCG